MLLGSKNLILVNEGILRIRKQRIKTNNMSNILSLNIPQEILEKYENYPVCKKKIMVTRPLESKDECLSSLNS